MEFSFWMYIVIFVSQFIGGSLALATFSSIYIKNKTKGYWRLSIIILGMIYTLILGFNASLIIGSGMIIVDFILALLAYFILQHKVHEATSN
ncbi:hypothetical protein EKG37_15975 [Robertmurraya yapensis]|uniref:DUF2198 family protein n=2 Tax=Bacillaceae TaxID=186817 RepID=A0A431W157_9BACI|nr:hypothetical protein [Bacillus yapensis]RTR29228.1 hypothetical protein EKG37_15975 [Bacillus yapensis]TKS94833.1 hypothetical protein FAR12_15975 [Bacillus yapensis]